MPYWMYVSALCLFFGGVSIGVVCAINGVRRPILNKDKVWRKWHMEGAADVRSGLFGVGLGLLVGLGGVDLSGFLPWWGLIGFFGLSLEVCYVAVTERRWWGYCSTGYIPVYWIAVPFCYFLWPVLSQDIDWFSRAWLYGITFHGSELLGMWVWRFFLGMSHSEVGYCHSGRGIFGDLIRWDYFPLWIFCGFLFEGVYRLLLATEDFSRLYFQG